MPDPKQLVTAFYADLNAGRLPASAPAGFGPGLTELLTAFPDIHYTLSHVVSDGDQVCVRWSWTGTHTGPFRGHAPTRTKVTNTGMAIFTVANGALASAALETDRLGFLQAIGVVDAQIGRPPAAR